ncbi:unnamed protein product [Gadus morhua 'NCC']
MELASWWSTVVWEGCGGGGPLGGAHCLGGAAVSSSPVLELIIWGGAVEVEPPLERQQAPCRYLCLPTSRPLGAPQLMTLMMTHQRCGPLQGPRSPAHQWGGEPVSEPVSHSEPVSEPVSHSEPVSVSVCV